MPGTLTRLRASPNYVQALTQDGRPYIAQEAEPYGQFWLSAREQLLLALFSRRGGLTEADASTAYLAATGTPASAAEQRRIARAIAGMRAAGVIVGPEADSSRYDAAIAAPYAEHRPFPREITEHIVRHAGIETASRVLDLAGGPGDLARQLARHSDAVTLMELSKGFLAFARRRATAEGLRLATLHDTCNRLVFHDGEYDAITVSQALHWLDDVMVCRGVARVLRPGGHFVVVHAAMEVADDHPLAYLLGHDSILGRKERRAFADEVQPLARRLALLFDALDAPDVDRIDPTRARTGAGRIGPDGIALFRQRRPFGIGYARGFLTPRHIEVTGMAPAAFWADLERRCAGVAPERFVGTHHWAVLRFRRGAAQALPEVGAIEAQAIGYDGAG